MINPMFSVKLYGIKLIDTKRVNNRAILTISIFLSSFLFSSCATTGIVGEVDPSAEKEKAELIEVQNKSLGKKIEIKSFNTREINQLLQVQVQILNKFSSTKTLQYKFSWFDKTGFEVEPESGPWKPVVMHGGAINSLQAVAPNESAKRFKIVIREK